MVADMDVDAGRLGPGAARLNLPYEVNRALYLYCGLIIKTRPRKRQVKVPLVVPSPSFPDPHYLTSHPIPSSLDSSRRRVVTVTALMDMDMGKSDQTGWDLS